MYDTLVSFSYKIKIHGADTTHEHNPRPGVNYCRNTCLHVGKNLLSPAEEVAPTIVFLLSEPLPFRCWSRNSDASALGVRNMCFKARFATDLRVVLGAFMLHVTEAEAVDVSFKWTLPGEVVGHFGFRARKILRHIRVWFDFRYLPPCSTASFPAHFSGRGLNPSGWNCLRWCIIYDTSWPLQRKVRFLEGKHLGLNQCKRVAGQRVHHFEQSFRDRWVHLILAWWFVFRPLTLWN